LFDSGSILAKNKLKILYIFYILNIPINNTDITKFVLDKDFMDYFSLQEIINGLKDDGFILHERKDGKNFYIISEEGRNTLEMFIEKIPKMYKDVVDNSFKSFKKEVEKKKQLVGHYFQRKDKDYTAILQAFEDDITVFNLSINVPDEETAKKIMKKWKDNPDKIYSEFINILFK
jgi:predicted transcriptional regulator